MTTTVVHTIGSGGDYSTLQAWNDAAPASLVSADEVWQGNCLSGFSVSGGTSVVLTISGSTTDATRYKFLTTAAGASFRDNASVQTNALRVNSSNGVAISASVYNGTTINVNEAYAQISKLQIENISNSPGQNPIVLSQGNVHIDGCILEGQGSGGSGSVLHSTTGSQLVTNTLVVARSSSINAVAALLGANTLVNCTLAVSSDKTAATNALQISYPSGVVIKNCAFFTGGGALPTTSTTYTTCYTDKTSPPTGCTHVTYDTSTGSGFQATTDSARDFRIKTGSALLDVGTTDSTNAPADIAGTSRPQGAAYDVGAWELVVSGGGRRFFSSIGGGLSGLGSSGPFFQNPIQ